MRIYVTKKDIASGLRKSSRSCPIALSLARRGKESYAVGKYGIWLDGVLMWELPAAARTFVRRFDAGRPVKSFSFVLK